MNVMKEHGRSGARPAGLLALITLAIATIAWLFYVAERDRIVHETKSNLAAVAELQSTQIAHWRAEQVGDARIVRANPLLAEAVESFLRRPRRESRDELAIWMSTRQQYHGYECIYLFDPRGLLRLSVTRGGEDTSSELRKVVQEALRSRQIVFGDFRRAEPSGDIDANIAVPIVRRQGHDTLCVGVFAFRIDAEEFLHPYLQARPYVTRTGESLIVRSAGSEVFLFGTPGPNHDAPPRRWMPAAIDSLLAVAAEQGAEGMVEGIDYRGQEVIAAVRPVAGSPWTLIAKIDRDEVYAPAYDVGYMIAAQAFVLVLLSAVGAGWVWRGRRAKFYHQQYVAETKISRLNRVYSVLSGINQAIVRIRDRRQLLEEACRIAVEESGFALSSIGLVSRRGSRVEMIAARRRAPGPGEASVDAVKGLPGKPGLAEAAVAGRRHIVVNRIDSEKAPGEWQVNALAQGFKSAAAFPLTAGGEVLGVATLFADEPDVFDDGEVRLLDELACDLGFALDVLDSREHQMQAEEKLRGLFDSDVMGILFGDVHGKILDANRKFLEVVGYTMEDLRDGRLRWTELTPPENLISESKKLREAKRTGLCPPFEKEYVRKDGTRVPVLVGYTLVGAEREHSVAFVLDLTETRKVEQALRASELRYKTLFESAHDAIFLMRGDRFIDCNATTLTMFGCSRDQILEKRPIDFSPPLQPDGVPSGVAAAARIRAAMEIGPQAFDWKHCRLDGSSFDAEVALNRVDLSGEQYLHAIVRDVTVRRQAEEKVRQLSRAVEQSPVSIVITDAAGAIEYVNRKFSEVTGYEPAEVLGKNPRILKGGNKSPEEYRELWQTIAAGREWRGEFINKKKDGSLFTEYASISPVSNGGGRITHFVAVKEDVTERKALEERLRQSQRMESIGTLAGGIAHDFNNILGIVLGHASILEQMGDDRMRRANSIQAVQQAVNRGAGLVRQILTFARKTEILVEPVNLNEIIGELDRMMRETFPRTISFRADLDPQIGAIEGDRTQLHQTFLNLCVNARDAMPAGGSLSMTTRGEDGAGVREKFPEAAGGAYVHVSVADTGSGMDEATRLRVFEPFFTTKDPGKGTGLGLAVVHGIVRSHAGFIAVDSAPGRGATFHLYFPVPERRAHAVAAPPEEKRDIPGGTETVLIVEDEEALRELLRMLLAEKGYTVVTANDGHEGVRLYREMQNAIGLVVSDIGLPGLDGTGAYRLMKEINPRVRVILASGFLEPKSRAEMAAAGVRGFVHKPYSSREILLKIREVLDAP